MPDSKGKSDPLPSDRKDPVSKKHQTSAGFSRALLAALLLTAGVGSGSWNRWKNVSSDRDLLLVEVDSLRNQLKEVQGREPFDDIRIFSLRSELGSASEAVLAWNQRLQKGVLELSHLTPNPENRPYVILIRDTAQLALVPGGSFTVEKEGKLRIPFSPKSHVTLPIGFAVITSGSAPETERNGRAVFSSANFLE